MIDGGPLSVKKLFAKITPTPMKRNNLSDEKKVLIIRDHFAQILQTLGLDLSDDSLKDTPKRIAEMYVNEIFSGLKIENFPKITTIENSMKYDQMIVVRKIKSISVCEHHFVSIDGLATVAYIPRKKVIGLSKINRVVKFFSRRPQVQERLTKQIADCLQVLLGTPDVAVFIEAKHFCVVQRGIEDSQSTTSTSDLRGAFRRDSKTRKEFLSMCNTNSFQ
ncbi:MAG: GTP cyclohydrolase I FolE [Pseudobdellovibrionaceae bacterium]